MNNLNIIEELDRFKDQSGDPYYALQIEGSWGSGKTHFIKNYLADRYPNNQEEGPGYLYITLFGAKSNADIEQQIAGQLFSSTERLAGIVLSSVISGTSSFFKIDKAVGGLQDKSSAAIFSKKLEAVKGGLVIFDDLERCSMPLKDALGIINRFIERDKFKVIILSNEQAYQRQDITKEDQENYAILRSFREKLIGRTLRLVADAGSAYQEFITNFQSKEASNIASKELDSAIAVFNASKRNNLRSLRFGLEAFDRLIKMVEGDNLDFSRMESLLHSCLYIALEHGAAMDEKIIVNPDKFSLRSYTRKENKSAQEQEEEGMAEDILNRYPHLSSHKLIIPLDVLFQLIARGEVSVLEIKSYINTSPVINDSVNIPLWRRLIEIWDYEVDDFINASNEAIEKFNKRQVRDPGELLHFAGIMFWRERYQDLSLSNNQKPEEFIKTYLDTLTNNAESLDLNFGVASFNRLTAYGYSALTSDENADRWKQIVTFIQEHMNEAGKANYPIIIDKIFSFLGEQGMDNYSLMTETERHYLEMPIFSDSDPNIFANFVLRNKKLDVYSLKWLKDRYAHQVTVEVRGIERPWLNKVYNEMQTQITSHPSSLGKWWMDIIDQNLKHLL